MNNYLRKKTIAPKRKKPLHLESELQRNCVKWFDYQYPQYRQLFFAIPNGGTRNPKEAAIMKGEGVRAGVADMFFSVPDISKYGLYIEFKVGKNKQTEAQQSFEKLVTDSGYLYEIITDFHSFKNLIENYLQ